MKKKIKEEDKDWLGKISMENISGGKKLKKEKPTYAPQLSNERIKEAISISNLLSKLRCSFVSEMISGEPNFTNALNCCRGYLNIFSKKLNKKIIDKLNKEIYNIEDLLPKVNAIYIKDKKKYWTNPSERLRVRRLIESLWRELETIEDRYGYGIAPQLYEEIQQQEPNEESFMVIDKEKWSKDRTIKFLAKELKEEKEKIECIVCFFDMFFKDEIDKWREDSKWKKGDSSKQSFWTNFSI